MKLINQFNEIKQNLDKQLAENGLVCAFHTATYPIILTVSPDISPEVQIGLYEDEDGGLCARDARLQIIFADGEIVIRTDERLIMTDALLTKIKGQAKKLHYLYLQAYHKLNLADRRELGLDNETDRELNALLMMRDDAEE